VLLFSPGWIFKFSKGRLVLQDLKCVLTQLLVQRTGVSTKICTGDPSELGCPDSGQEIPQAEVLPVGGQETCQLSNGGHFLAQEKPWWMIDIVKQTRLNTYPLVN